MRSCPLGSLPAEVQQEVMSLVRRVTTNPYDPEIVIKANMVSPDTEHFAWTLANGHIMFWKVESRMRLAVGGSDPLKVTFLAIRRSKKTTK